MCFLIWHKLCCWFIVGFFTDTVEVRLFKLITVILLWVYQFILGLMTLTSFEGHRCVRIINCKIVFLDSCPPWFRHCMFRIFIKKIRHSMLCVTAVYLRDITIMNFSILHWNVSHLSVWSYWLFFVVVFWRGGALIQLYSNFVQLLYGQGIYKMLFMTFRVWHVPEGDQM